MNGETRAGRAPERAAHRPGHCYARKGKDKPDKINLNDATNRRLPILPLNLLYKQNSGEKEAGTSESFTNPGRNDSRRRHVSSTTS